MRNKLRKSKLIAILLTVLAIAILVKLGFWQLDRAAEKEQLFADYKARQTTSINLNTTEQPISSLNRYAEISVTGTFLNNHLLLDNQILDGQAGYQVIGLLEAQFAGNPNSFVMVNMGWVPWGRDRQQLPQLELPRGEITVTGFFYQPQLSDVWGAGDTYIEAERWPMRVTQLDTKAIAEATQLPIQPYVVLLSETAEYGWPRQWQPQVMTPEKHRAYALQWFSLALACLLVFWFASRSKKITTEE
jgi:surfeit locus 1 family protein